MLGSGFDIIYSLQDEEFDRSHSLRSLPETIGKAKALAISRTCHIAAVGFLIGAGLLFHAGIFYMLGVAFAALLLCYEQSLVKPNDLSRVNMAFFTLNGFVSIGLFLFALMDQLRTADFAHTQILGYNEPMKEAVFGRTNRQFPKVWLALNAPSREESIQNFVDLSLATSAPLDISASPALFGGFLPNNCSAILIQSSSLDIERSIDSKHAADLVQAHLIETLSSIGRPYIDFYFLRSRIAFEEVQLAGIWEALEAARQEGHIRHFGLRVESFPASVGNWQFHDAFDAVSVPETLSTDESETIKRMAAPRRTGYLLRTENFNISPTQSETVLVTVKSAHDLEALGIA